MHLQTPFSKFLLSTYHADIQHLAHLHITYHGYNKNIIPD